MSGRRHRRGPSVGAAGLVVALAAGAAGVVSCGADSPEPTPQDPSTFDPHQGVAPTAPVEEGELPEPGPTDLSGLDEDDRALALREEHVVGGDHTTLLEVRRLVPEPGDAPGPGAGQVWVGVRVRTCFESELDRQLEIGSYSFSVVDEDSFSYPGIQPGHAGWPVPQYPGYGRLAPGQCTSGWVAIPVPEGVTPISVVQSAVTGGPVAEWTVPAEAW